jgi:hypothetical protein
MVRFTHSSFIYLIDREGRLRALMLRTVTRPKTMSTTWASCWPLPEIFP